MLVAEIYRVEGLIMGVNYGSNRVRYPAPVPAGSSIRAGAELLSLQHGPTGCQTTLGVTIERDGASKPVCVAEVVSLLVSKS
jgi:acyl dehydratase